MARSKEQNTEPKLPVRQLAILAVVRFSEPLALTSVYPYLPEMIKSFGVPQDEVAKWAGLTSAIFAVAQSVTAVPWGWASDVIGRKPTLILGLIATMTCFIFWGMSSSLPMAITVRAIHGSGNGNVGIIRTMVAEMVPEKVLQPRAFSIMPMVWSIGSVFGPSFGGFFARPAEQFPGLFGNNEFLKKYPFILPNLIACVFFLFSVVTATLFLQETLESRKHKADWGLDFGEKLASAFCRGRPSKKAIRARARAQARAQDRARRQPIIDDEASAPLLSTPNHHGDADAEADDRPPFKTAAARIAAKKSTKPAPKPGHRHIFTYQTNIALLCYSLLALHSVSYDQLLPVFLNYPYQEPNETNTRMPFKFSSGFGLNSGRIGTMFTLTAIVSGFAQFIVFPPVCSRFGALNCYRFASIVLPIIYFITPYTALVPGERLRFAVFMIVFVTKGALGIVTFPCITIILTNSAPSTKVLGTVNGFATTFSSVGKAIGPALTGAAFTWGTQHGYVITGMWLLACIATISAICTFFLGEGEGLHHDKEEDDSTEADDDDDDDEALEDLLEESEDGIEDGYSYDGNDSDDYEESLLGEHDDDDNNNGGHHNNGSTTGHNTSLDPLSPIQHRRQHHHQLPKLRPPTELHHHAHLHMSKPLSEPEDLDPYDAEANAIADVDLSAPTTPVRTRRFRSASTLSILGRPVATTAADGDAAATTAMPMIAGARTGTGTGSGSGADSGTETAIPAPVRLRRMSATGVDLEAHGTGGDDNGSQAMHRQPNHGGEE